MSCCGGKCGCGSSCQCGTGCGGCKMSPDVEATVGAAATMVMTTASRKATSGGMEIAGEEAGGCDCTTCKCGTACSCSCCSCN